MSKNTITYSSADFRFSPFIICFFNVFFRCKGTMWNNSSQSPCWSFLRQRLQGSNNHTNFAISYITADTSAHRMCVSYFLHTDPATGTAGTYKQKADNSLSSGKRGCRIPYNRKINAVVRFVYPIWYNLYLLIHKQTSTSTCS